MIAAVFLLFGNPMGGNDPGPAAGDSTGNDEGRDKPGKPGTSTPTPVATSDPSQEPGAPAEGEVAAVYYVGVTPGGPRLYREFQKAPGDDAFERALYLLQNKPLDPDYMPLWPEGSLADAVYDGEVIHVAITSPEYRMIPAGVDEATAQAAVESVIYTLQGAAQERAPVQFRFDGNPVDQVYGVPTSEPLANGPILETLNHMSITEPAQASTHSGEMAISGVGNSFEANIQWKLLGEWRRRRRRGLRHRRGLDGGEALPLVRHMSTCPGWSPAPTRSSPRPTTRPVAPRATVPRSTPSRSAWCQ